MVVPFPLQICEPVHSYLYVLFFVSRFRIAFYTRFWLADEDQLDTPPPLLVPHSECKQQCNKTANNTRSSDIRAQSDKQLKYVSLTSSSCELLLRSCCHENDGYGTLYWKKEKLNMTSLKAGNNLLSTTPLLLCNYFFSSYVSSQGSKKEVIWKVYNFSFVTTVA